MNRTDLLKKHQKFRENWAIRFDKEERIINALPYKLNVERVSSPSRPEGVPEDGSVEIEVATIADAMNLPALYNQLGPVRMAHTIRTDSNKTDAGRVTHGFMPLSRVPWQWHVNSDGRKVEEIYPILAQLAPSDDPARPRYYLEWYAELAKDLIANIRVTIRQHDITWQPHFLIYNGVQKYRCVNAPQGGDKRVLYTREDQPPFITIWWRGPDSVWPFCSREKEGQREAT